MKEMKAAPFLALFVVVAGAFMTMPGAMAADPGFSSVPGQPVEPGSTVRLDSDAIFDLGTATAKLTQNGEEHVTTFQLDKSHISDSMGSAQKGGGGAETLVFATYSDYDVMARLSMTVVYDKVQAGTLAKEGLALTFLVTEASGGNVSVQLTGKKAGADVTLTATVQVKPLTASKFAIGQFMQPLGRGYYYQNESMPLYALGYDSPVEMTIKDESGAQVTQMAANAKGKLAYQVWKVPIDQKTGNYTISVKPTGNHKDCFGQDGAYSLKVEVQKALENKDSGGGPRPPTGTTSRSAFALPGWAPLAMVAAVLIVGVPIGILLIRKKKD